MGTGIENGDWIRKIKLRRGELKKRSSYRGNLLSWNDADYGLERILKMQRLKSLAFIYASIFSLLIGLGAGIFLTISSELISLFWSKRILTHPGLLLLQCLLFGLVIAEGRGLSQDDQANFG